MSAVKKHIQDLRNQLKADDNVDFIIAEKNENALSLFELKGENKCFIEAQAQQSWIGDIDIFKSFQKKRNEEGLDLRDAFDKVINEQKRMSTVGDFTIGVTFDHGLNTFVYLELTKLNVVLPQKITLQPGESTILPVVGSPEIGTYNESHLVSREPTKPAIGVFISFCHTAIIFYPNEMLSESCQNPTFEGVKFTCRDYRDFVSQVDEKYDLQLKGVVPAHGNMAVVDIQKGIKYMDMEDPFNKSILRIRTLLKLISEANELIQELTYCDEEGRSTGDKKRVVLLGCILSMKIALDSCDIFPNLESLIQSSLSEQLKKIKNEFLECRQKFKATEDLYFSSAISHFFVENNGWPDYQINPNLMNLMKTLLEIKNNIEHLVVLNSDLVREKWRSDNVMQKP